MKRLKFSRWFWSIIILAMVLTGCANGNVDNLDSTNGTSISQTTDGQNNSSDKNNLGDNNGSEDQKDKNNQSDQQESSDDKSNNKSEKENQNSDNSGNKDKDNDTDLGKMKVHFIDVGQGDSILIESNGSYLLIDAGENNKGNIVVDYLKSVGVTQLDYVIGTHPHSDHIGGLDTVLNNFTTDKVIMPNVAHNTATFEDVLTAISKQGLKITKPVVGTEYQLGEATFTIIGPNSKEYDDLNDYSVGVKLTHGDMSFVFTGDSDSLAEGEMVSNGLDISAGVLKLAHHGSRYSNTDAFLNSVSPSIAVITVGEGNSYGHPHQEVLDAMKERGITVYRTDLSGTIIAVSDGKDVTFNVKSTEDAYINEASDNEDSVESPSTGNNSNTGNNSSTGNNTNTGSTDSQSNNSNNSNNNQEQEDNTSKVEMVHITESGSKYHRAGCRYLNESDMEISLESALGRGLEPCSVCY